MFKVGVEQKLPEFSHIPPEIQVIVQMCHEVDESKRTTAVKLLKSMLNLLNNITFMRESELSKLSLIHFHLFHVYLKCNSPVN